MTHPLTPPELAYYRNKAETTGLTLEEAACLAFDVRPPSEMYYYQEFKEILIEQGQIFQNFYHYLQGNEDIVLHEYDNDPCLIFIPNKNKGFTLSKYASLINAMQGILGFKLSPRLLEIEESIKPDDTLQEDDSISEQTKREMLFIKYKTELLNDEGKLIYTNTHTWNKLNQIDCAIFPIREKKTIEKFFKIMRDNNLYQGSAKRGRPHKKA